MADKYQIESCGRCGGSGVFHFSTSSGAESGMCFRCNGTGKVRVNLSAIKRKESAERNRMERGNNNWKQFAADHPELVLLTGTENVEALRALNNAFLMELRSKIFDHGILSDRQLEAAREAIQRQMERKQAQEAAKATKIERSKHLGQIGERMTVSLIYKYSISVEVPSFGRNSITELKHGHFFETADGSVVVWWTTSTDLGTIEKDTAINAKFTVKKHDVYKDVNQTQVSRLTF